MIHDLLSPVMHLKRLASLDLMLGSALLTKKIAVTSLGRGINLPIKERSAIRRSDRLIGNKGLQKELPAIEKAFIQVNLGAKTRPVLAVDWSQVPNTKNHILRAVMIADHITITLLDEVHPETKLNNAKVELKFLSKLKSYLPEDCKPIILTDAGFRVPWFKRIEKFGWDYVGRVRGTPQYFDGKGWVPCKDIIVRAKTGLRYLGKHKLNKTKSLETFLYLIKQKPKKRKSTRRKPGGKRDELNHKRAGKEAWLIASSLEGGNFIKTKRIQKLYSKRMRIEHSFRDNKSHHFGFGLRNAYSRDLKRIEVLLLILKLALWIASLIGRYLEKNNYHLDFQSNSIKKKRVISIVYLGCRALQRKIPIPDLGKDLSLWENG
jgi:hypothetical protein